MLVTKAVPTTPEQTVALLAETPRCTRELVDGLDDAELVFHPRGAEWSIQGHHPEWSMAQHVCHLRDLEQEGYGIRVMRFVAEPMPVFPDVDGERLAAERDYDGHDVPAALDLLERARRRTLDDVRTMLDCAESLQGHMEGLGDITLVDLLGMMYGHDAGHLDMMQRLRYHLLQRRGG